MRIGKIKIFDVLLFVVFLPMLVSCFTGIEGTKKITQKDVDKVAKEMSEAENKNLKGLEIKNEAFKDWPRGKEFYVTDNNFKLVLSATKDYDKDTIDFEGKILKYDGYYTGSMLDNNETVNVKLTDGEKEYIYSSGRKFDEIGNTFSIPFLVDMDMIKSVSSQIEGKEYYVKSSMWYDKTGNAINGRKFVKIKITNVLPGNKNFPVRVLFTALDKNENAMVYLTIGETLLRNRSFDELFSRQDVRKQYPDITDENWQLIVNGKVASGMTKVEVRLSLGKPINVDQRPTYEGLMEFWFYNNGLYLIFEDGLLTKYSR